MKIKIIQPNYYKEFRCIMSKCKNNCCDTDWNIYVNKNIYKKYDKMRMSRELSLDIRQYIVLNDENIKSKYAKILKVIDKDTSKKKCPFLNNLGYCRIHSELGEENLGDVCKLYPRKLNYVQFDNSELNFFEKACFISCEEVLNIFFRTKDYIDYELLEEEVNAYRMEAYFTTVSIYVSENRREIIKYYADIKSIIIAILQSREYAFEDRMVLLTVFCYRLNDIETSNNIEIIPKFIEEFVKSVDLNMYDSILQQNVIINSSRLDEMFSMLINCIVQFANRDYELYQILLKNMGDVSSEGIKNKIVSKISNYKILLNENEIFFEHIFVNECFIRMIPFSKNLSIYENIQLINIIYVLYKIMIMLYIIDKDNISNEELIDITSYFAKSFLHSEYIDEQLIEITKKLKLDSISDWLYLLKL